MSSPFHIVIPARLESTRLPKKILADIGGKPMLQHTFERACATTAKSILIATDDERVAQIAKNFGADVCLTRKDHQSGTERIAEAITARRYAEDDIIVGLQSDVPFIAPANIEQVAAAIAANPKAKIATLYKPLLAADDVHNPNVVKVILNHEGYAIYFSRAVIPWSKAETTYLSHVGLYAYRASYLRTYTNYAPAAIEIAESLEQLRALYYGDPIYVAHAQAESPISVDTPDDLARARALV